MPIDNTIYDRLAETWWQEDSPLYLLRTAVNPARFGYFRSVLGRTLGLDCADRRTLDVGCGGGLLAEEFAHLGCHVTGIDPSGPSVAAARAHAAAAAVNVAYCVAAGEALPFRDASFEIVYCCDVLEHVGDVERVVAESARVLRPGGVYLYDAIRWSRSSSCRSGSGVAFCRAICTTGAASSRRESSMPSWPATGSRTRR